MATKIILRENLEHEFKKEIIPVSILDLFKKTNNIFEILLITHQPIIKINTDLKILKTLKYSIYDIKFIVRAPPKIFYYFSKKLHIYIKERHINMKRLKNKIFILVSCLICTVTLTQNFVNTCALEILQNTNSVQNNKYNAGEKFSVKLEFDSNEVLEKYLDNNHVLEIEFDNNKLKYKKFNYNGKFRKKNFELINDNNIIELSHEFEENPKKTRKNQQNYTETMEFWFNIKNNCDSGETNIIFRFVNLETQEQKIINTQKINIIGNPDLHTCKLQNLEPDTGILNKKFHPDVFNYELIVEHDTKYINFNLKTMSKFLKTKINKSKLNPAGTCTDIKISVSNPNLKIKNIYNIKVYRKDKPTKHKPNKITKNNIKNNTQIQKLNKNNFDNNARETKNAHNNKSQNNEPESFISNFTANSPETNSPAEIIVTPDNSQDDSQIYAIIFCTLLTIILIYFVITLLKKHKNSKTTDV